MDAAADARLTAEATALQRELDLLVATGMTFQEAAAQVARPPHVSAQDSTVVISRNARCAVLRPNEPPDVGPC